MYNAFFYTFYFYISALLMSFSTTYVSVYCQNGYWETQPSISGAEFFLAEASWNIIKHH